MEALLAGITVSNDNETSNEMLPELVNVS
jgi:hypothetical protein